MSHEAENKKEAAAASEAEKTVTPETEPKAEGKHEEKHESKHEHHHEKAALEAKLEASEKKNEELKNQLLRTAAEYDNYRKRSQREADQKFNDGVSHAVTQILGILDTLDMAANAACADEKRHRDERGREKDEKHDRVRQQHARRAGIDREGGERQPHDHGAQAVVIARDAAHERGHALNGAEQIRAHGDEQDHGREPAQARRVVTSLRRIYRPKKPAP